MGQPKYERGIFPRGQGLSFPSKVVEAGIEALNPYPMNLQTGERELATPGLFEAIAMGGRGIASAIKDPSGTYEKLAPMLDQMGKRMVASTTLRPGQMEMVDGELRPLTSEEVVQERIDAGMDPTVAFAGAAPIARGVAREGIGALVQEPGVLASGGARTTSNVTMPGHNTPNKVVDLGVKFKSEHPAFKNMAVSYVEPVDSRNMAVAERINVGGKILDLEADFKAGRVGRGEYQTRMDELETDANFYDLVYDMRQGHEVQKEMGHIQRYPDTDNPTGTEALGIIRVTAPQDDILRASGGKNAGPVDIGHDPMFTGGETGLSPQDIVRRKAAIEAEIFSLRAAIEDDNIVSGVPKDLDLDSEEAGVFLYEKALATVKQKELKGELDYSGPKNAPVGFARFADIELEGQPYMRLTEIQSDLFKETRSTKKGETVRDVSSNEWAGGEELPELYPNMKKDDKPLSSAVLKASVASGIERGAKGIVLPNSFTSAAGVRYSDSNVKKLLNKTVKDLGEGFTYRKVEVPSYYKDDVKVTEHYVLEFPEVKSVPDEMKFATGGLVSLPPRSASRGIEDVIKRYRRDGWMD